MVFFKLIVGLLLLVGGAEALVRGASRLAAAIGVSPLVIGLTVVAFGTSAPEMAVSTLSGMAGNSDIALGNVVGSNIFNLLAVLGVSAMASTNGISISKAALYFDMPVMIATALACLPVFFTGNAISRLEGLGFLAYYAAYVMYLYLAASKHHMLPLFSMTMTSFVLPLTVLTLAIVVIPKVRSGRRQT